jgi:hypothetical protein
MKEFVNETTRRFIAEYQELKPGIAPLLGLDTDFTPPGDTRDWVFAHPDLSVMIQGKNRDSYYVDADESIDLVKRFKKPYCPQESLDLPGITHIPDARHKNSLTYYDSGNRTHLRKYVWRWILARSQLIDFYQKSLSESVTERERYDPEGHNLFEKDAIIIRAVWNEIYDYPNLGFYGEVESGPGEIQMVLSSKDESLVYLASKPGAKGIQYPGQELLLNELSLTDGKYVVEIWKPAFPGGRIDQIETECMNRQLQVRLPEFVDDLLLHVVKINN